MSQSEAHQTRRESALLTAIWIAPIFLATVLPGFIWAVSERPMATRPDRIVAMSLIVLVIALLVLAGLSHGFRHRLRWSAGVTTMIILVLFQWPILTGVGNVVASALHVSFLRPVLPVLLAIAFLRAATLLGDELPFAVLVSASLLVVSGALFFNTQTRVATSPSRTEPVAAAPGSPDVLLLILDGYTRDDVLSSRFGFDNSPFLAGLEDLGFTVAREAGSNYNFTYAAISTMFNLDYVFDVGEITDAEREMMRESLAGDPALFREFREHGYEVAYTQNFWAGSNCGGAVDLCWREGLTKGALWSLGRMTVLAPFVQKLQPHPFHTISVDHLAALSEIVQNGRAAGTPRLTVAHVILPHQPFLLNADCEAQHGPGRETLTNPNPDHVELRQRYYVDQMVCTNSMVINEFRDVIEARPDTVIMVTADHGSDSTQVAGLPHPWSDAEIGERMHILSAYRLPGCDVSVSQSITPVNGIRAVTNCAVDSDLAELPDRQLWVPQHWAGEVIDLSPRLGS